MSSLGENRWETVEKQLHVVAQARHQFIFYGPHGRMGLEYSLSYFLRLAFVQLKQRGTKLAISAGGQPTLDTDDVITGLRRWYTGSQSFR